MLGSLVSMYVYGVYTLKTAIDIDNRIDSIVYEDIQQLSKPICAFSVGAVGTVFIGKLASAKPPLKPGDIEEVVDPKKPPKPPKPGTSKQNGKLIRNLYFSYNLFYFKFQSPLMTDIIPIGPPSILKSSNSFVKKLFLMMC